MIEELDGRVLARSGLRRCTTCRDACALERFAGPARRKCDRCRAARPPRRCHRCGEVREADLFLYGGKVCAPCREAGTAAPRACLRCHVVKPADAFAWGDGHGGRGCYRRRRGVCEGCLTLEVVEAEQRRAAWQATFIDPETGVTMRRCSGECGQTLELDAYFYPCKRDAAGNVVKRDYRCKRCQAARVNARAAERRADPVLGPIEREQQRAWKSKWRKRNPERYHELQRRWYRRMMADPTRAARHRESARLAYHLKRELSGKATRRVQEVEQPRYEGPRMLPAAPLVAAVESFCKRTERDLSSAYVGVDERSVRRWRDDLERGLTPTVHFDSADAVLVAIGLEWWDVWTADAYEAVYRELAGDVA